RGRLARARGRDAARRSGVAGDGAVAWALRPRAAHGPTDRPHALYRGQSACGLRLARRRRTGMAVLWRRPDRVPLRRHPAHGLSRLRSFDDLRARADNLSCRHAAAATVPRGVLPTLRAASCLAGVAAWRRSDGLLSRLSVGWAAERDHAAGLRR